ncbi:ABC transporter permease [Patescibacteria group bacterium]|nr:ABC transporter permease [Patescibacteria group bacterium]
MLDSTIKTKKTLRQIAGVVASLKQVPIVPFATIFVMMVVAITADWIAPHSPVEGNLSISLLPPSWMDGGNLSYLLGTDRFGRDVLSRLIYGARVSMSVACLAITITAALGTLVGLMAGYLGGFIDTILMRLADVFMSFPGILIALILAVVLGPSFTNVVIIVLIILWPRFARQVRGEALSIKEQDFVVLARAMGVSSWKVMWRHIFPNVIPSLAVLVTFEVGWVIILEATLAFLGVGIPPPNPSWGVMIADGRNYLEMAWWISFFPGVAIGLSVFGFNMLGDWVRDRLDPKLRQI